MSRTSRMDVAPLLLEQAERLYAKAKSGMWEDVWRALVGERELAGVCSRYVKPSSGWTFLHQAAHAGDEAAVRCLLRWGSSLSARSKDGETPRDVATKRGHEVLAAMMGEAERGASGSWEPSPAADLLPSSSMWHPLIERRAWRELRVSYGSACIVIPAGARYYVDAFERIVIGWHGTYDPPGDM